MRPGSGPGGPAQPTRIGNARPSQLITTAGVGSVVDLPGMSVVVRGLEAWGAGGLPISEPRLLDQVRRSLPSDNVTSLRAAPSNPQAADDPWTREGVPVTTFPRWLRCPACSALLTIDASDHLELHHRWGRRPDLAKWVHKYCNKQANTASRRRRACIPARFVVACPRGHLDEFPYVAFVHHGAQVPCPAPRLEMRDAGSVLGPRVSISCVECGAARNVSAAAGVAGRDTLPKCRGRHPHLQSFTNCDQQLKLMVLGASNLWFGATLSALHLPEDDPVVALVGQHFDFLQFLPKPQLFQMVTTMANVDPLRALTADELWDAVEAERARRVQAGDADDSAEPPDLRDAEWDLLCHPTTQRNDDDFRAFATPNPPGYDGLLQQVVQVDRLREVQAMVGFSRVGAPSGDTDRRVRLASGHVGWVPAVERRGEGIFLELPEDRVTAWVKNVDDHDDIVKLRSAYERWLSNRDQPPQPQFPAARYLLVHTLAHVLLRQVALECGYGSASIRERLYVGRPARPTAGLLLSTAASDSEGTLGGLVALADRKFLHRLLDDAFEDAERCSSDPLCGERIPSAPSDQLHAAACHACLFSSETSCEAGNRWLHRGVLVDLGKGLAFQR